MKRDPLDRLRAALDRELVGQGAAKTGLVLALLARQHVYLEGPPGCGKSHLAEALGRLAGCRSMLVACHRDLRSSDLLGDAVLRRERRRGREESIRVETIPGRLAESEVLVIDDVARAPGEALAPLLHILSERRMPIARGRRTYLPLETAIATGPTELAAGYAEALEPGQLDRFAVQIELEGHLQARRWRQAAATIAKRESDPGLVRKDAESAEDPAETTGAAAAPLAADPGDGAVLTREERHSLQRQTAALEIPNRVRAAWAELLMRLATAADSERGFPLRPGDPMSERRPLLTERAFITAAGPLLRAHAYLRGGERVEPGDLRVFRYLVARRLPRPLKNRLVRLIEEVIAEERSDEGAAVAIAAPAFASASAAGENLPARDATDDNEPLPPALLRADASPPDSAAVASLLRAIGGRIERGRLDGGEDPGGQPRAYRPLHRLDELFDADPVEALLLLESSLPAGARVFRRERRARAGAVVVLRDTSASMAGELAAWSGAVVAGVVRLAARRRMRIGYIEFDHHPYPHLEAERLLHRRYRRLLGVAANQRAAGRTNYEAPLRLALSALRRGGRARQRDRHILLLTDGVPVLGDPQVRRERDQARRLAVAVHTVFLGRDRCPSVLDALSLETGGLRFAVRPGSDGGLTVEKRGTA